MTSGLPMYLADCSQLTVIVSTDIHSQGWVSTLDRGRRLNCMVYVVKHTAGYITVVNLLGFRFEKHYASFL